MEDDLNERRPQWKMTSMEDDLNGRWPQWKMTSMKYDLNGRRPQLSMRQIFNLKKNDYNLLQDSVYLEVTA